MNGIFAVLTLVLGMNDAFYNCDGNCLARLEVQDRIAISQGSLQFRGDVIGREVYARYDSSRANGPFQSIYGVSYSSLGDFWAGAGHSYTMKSEGNGFYSELHAMTGLYVQGSGPDLGGGANGLDVVGRPASIDNDWLWPSPSDQAATCRRGPDAGGCK